MVPIIENPRVIYTRRLAKSLIFFLLPLQLMFAFTPVYIDMLQADRTDLWRYLGGNLWIGAIFYGLMAAAMQRFIIFLIFYHKRGWKKHKSSDDDGYGELINKSFGITVGVSFLLIGIAFFLLAYTIIYTLYFGIAAIIASILAFYKALTYDKKSYYSERQSNYND